jgi:hypothetical protein
VRSLRGRIEGTGNDNGDFRSDILWGDDAGTVALWGDGRGADPRQHRRQHQPDRVADRRG